MVKYLYERYRVKTTWEGAVLKRNTGFVMGYSQNGLPVYPSISYTVANGFEKPPYTGTMKPIAQIQVGDIVDYHNSDTVRYYNTFNSIIDDKTVSVTRHYYEPIYTRGAFVDTVEAENGTYPTNGMQGGYWYVPDGVS